MAIIDSKVALSDLSHIFTKISKTVETQTKEKENKSRRNEQILDHIKEEEKAKISIGKIKEVTPSKTDVSLLIEKVKKKRNDNETTNEEIMKEFSDLLDVGFEDELNEIISSLSSETEESEIEDPQNNRNVKPKASGGLGLGLWRKLRSPAVEKGQLVDEKNEAEDDEKGEGIAKGEMKKLYVLQERIKKLKDQKNEEIQRLKRKNFEDKAELERIVAEKDVEIAVIREEFMQELASLRSQVQENHATATAGATAGAVIPPNQKDIKPIVPTSRLPVTKLPSTTTPTAGTSERIRSSFGAVVSKTPKVTLPRKDGEPATITKHIGYVKVIEAEHLGRHDPYVEVTLGQQSKKTTIKKNEPNPVWNEEFKFDNADCEEMIIKVIDWDRLTVDDILGEMKVPLKDLLSSSGSKTFQFGEGGKLKISYRFEEIQIEQHQPAESADQATSEEQQQQQHLHTLGGIKDKIFGWFHHKKEGVEIESSTDLSTQTQMLEEHRIALERAEPIYDQIQAFKRVIKDLEERQKLCADEVQRENIEREIGFYQQQIERLKEKQKLILQVIPKQLPFAVNVQPVLSAQRPLQRPLQQQKQKMFPQVVSDGKHVEPAEMPICGNCHSVQHMRLWRNQWKCYECDSFDVLFEGKMKTDNNVEANKPTVEELQMELNQLRSEVIDGTSKQQILQEQLHDKTNECSILLHKLSSRSSSQIVGIIQLNIPKKDQQNLEILDEDVREIRSQIEFCNKQMIITTSKLVKSLGTRDDVQKLKEKLGELLVKKQENEKRTLRLFTTGSSNKQIELLELKIQTQEEKPHLQKEIQNLFNKIKSLSQKLKQKSYESETTFQNLMKKFPDDQNIRLQLELHRAQFRADEIFQKETEILLFQLKAADREKVQLQIDQQIERQVVQQIEEIQKDLSKFGKPQKQRKRGRRRRKSSIDDFMDLKISTDHDAGLEDDDLQDHGEMALPESEQFEIIPEIDISAIICDFLYTKAELSEFEKYDKYGTALKTFESLEDYQQMQQIQECLSYFSYPWEKTVNELLKDWYSQMTLRIEPSEIIVNNELYKQHKDLIEKEKLKFDYLDLQKKRQKNSLPQKEKDFNLERKRRRREAQRERERGEPKFGERIHKIDVVIHEANDTAPFQQEPSLSQEIVERTKYDRTAQQAKKAKGKEKEEQFVQQISDLKRASLAGGKYKPITPRKSSEKLNLKQQEEKCHARIEKLRSQRQTIESKLTDLGGTTSTAAKDVVSLNRYSKQLSDLNALIEKEETKLLEITNNLDLIEGVECSTTGSEVSEYSSSMGAQDWSFMKQKQPHQKKQQGKSEQKTAASMAEMLQQAVKDLGDDDENGGDLDEY